VAAPVIVRVRSTPGGVDEYGDPVAGTTTETTLAGAYVAPRESDEITNRGRAGVIVGLTLFAPYDTDLRHNDRIKVDGVLYDIEGEPGRWRNPFTDWEAGIQAALRRTAG
jgi:hypothetical protein